MPRVATWVPGRLKLSGPGWIDCVLRDVGTGGACIETSSPIGTADIRWLEMDLPGGALKLSVEGKWQREAGPEQAILTGVCFADPEPETLQRIEDFVHERLLGLVRLLQGCPALSDLGLDEAMDLALVSRYRTATAGRYLYVGGSESSDDSVFAVSRGSISIEADIHGLRVPVGRVETGEIFGGISLLAPALKPYLSAVAARDAILLEIDRSSYDYLRRAKPIVAARLANAVVDRHVRQLHECIERVVQRLS